MTAPVHARALLLLALVALLASRAAATAEFLVVQKAIVNNPADHSSLSVEDHAASHFSEVLKSVRAAFTVKPAPRAAVFVDAGPDPTLHGQKDRRKNRRMLRSTIGAQEGPVLLAAGRPLRQHPVTLGDDVREHETNAASSSFRAAKLARSFFTPANVAARVALAKANGDR